MKYLNQFYNQIILMGFSLKKINLFKVFVNQKKDSKNIIWIFPGWPLGSFSYFGSAAVIQDLALIYSCIKNLEDYRIVIGPKIGRHRNKNIFYLRNISFQNGKCTWGWLKTMHLAIIANYF